MNFVESFEGILKWDGAIRLVEIEDTDFLAVESLQGTDQRGFDVFRLVTPRLSREHLRVYTRSTSEVQLPQVLLGSHQ